MSVAVVEDNFLLVVEGPSSVPQNDGRAIGAGVTGREGRSVSLGKSVSLKPRDFRGEAGWGDDMFSGEEMLPAVGVDFTRRCFCRPST